MDEYGNKVQKKRTLKQKIFRAITGFFIAIFTLIILYAEFNIGCSIYESSRLKSYHHGKNYNVNGHTMVADIVGSADKPTIVIFTGFGSYSPILHYKPLTEAFSDKYRFVTLEPFGYGLSDSVDEERTITNIVSEYHNIISQIGVEKYYIMGHSLGGLYSLYYANQYPNEVLGFIGLDSVLTNNVEDYEEGVTSLKVFAFLNDIGYERMMSLFNKRNLSIPLYDKYNYTDEEIEMFRIIAIKKGLNKSIINEYSLISQNMRFVGDIKFPQNVRVLNTISDSISEGTPNWKEDHILIGSNSTYNEVVEFHGDHLFFMLENLEAFRAKIDSFIV